MRNRLSGISSRAAARLAGAVCLASLAAGCSSDVMRFDHGITASVPAPIQGQHSVVQPVRGTAPMVQPYPGDVSRQSPQYDRTYTGSVPTGKVARLAPPSNIQPVYQRPTSVGMRHQVPTYQQQPVYRPQLTYQAAAPQPVQPPVERRPLAQAPVSQPAAPQVQLAPVPVASSPTSVSSNSRPAIKTVEVPVSRIPIPRPAQRGAVTTQVAQAQPQSFPRPVATDHTGAGSTDHRYHAQPPGQCPDTASRQRMDNSWRNTGHHGPG